MDEAAAAAGDGAERKVKRAGNKRVTCRPLLAVLVNHGGRFIRVPDACFLSETLNLKA